MKKFMKIIETAFPREVYEQGEFLLSKRDYGIGVSIILFCSYAQYLLKGGNPLAAVLFVYGIPVAAVSYIFGTPILRQAFRHTSAALKFGASLFGIFSLLGILAASVVFSILMMIDPRAANLMYKPNPVLHISPKFAWIMVWLSLFVVGPVEEYIFRGFVYGGMLALFKRRHWLSLAFLSSGLFAMAHLYYGLVYGVVSLAIFAELLFVGMAFAATYYLSGGNLVIPVILHGLYDATGFMAVAVSEEVGIFLRVSMVIAGNLVALGLLARGIFLQIRRR